MPGWGLVKPRKSQYSWRRDCTVCRYCGGSPAGIDPPLGPLSSRGQERPSFWSCRSWTAPPGWAAIRPERESPTATGSSGCRSPSDSGSRCVSAGVSRSERKSAPAPRPDSRPTRSERRRRRQRWRRPPGVKTPTIYWRSGWRWGRTPRTGTNPRGRGKRRDCSAPFRSGPRFV